MQNPIREQIRLNGRWHSRRIDEGSVSVFVPGSWAEKQVLLRTGAPGADEQPVPGLAPGEWNTVALPPGAPEGARLVAGDDLRITGLAVDLAGDRALAIQVRLACGATIPGRIALHCTLSAADGRLVGSAEAVAASKADEISLTMKLAAPPVGPHRLKATLTCGDQVLDNARIDITS